MARNPDEEIVISGISGKYPESANVGEFKHKLFEGIDMVTNDDRRFPSGLFGLPTRSGKLKDLSGFDAGFFGLNAKHTEAMDPQSRILLELTFEAILDAGYNPSELRGSNTGVFIGVSDSEAWEAVRRELNLVSRYGLIGCYRTMFPNRISYAFDFNGPSYAVDTACSSSLFAVHQAMVAIQTGQCDAAIVGGVNLILNPTSSLQYHRLGLLNKDGACKTFDDSGNGYVRAEAAVVVLLQKASAARRLYATLLAAKTNTDGYKTKGITFPSKEMQSKLLEAAYSDAGIAPAQVSFFEAHGTGTRVGDPQEMNAITDFFFKTRSEPLMVGSVKTNMGHAEPASGLCSLTKVILAMETGTIPGNLHFNIPNKNIPGLHDGRLEVIARNKTTDCDIVGINSFGLGGANAHIVVQRNQKLDRARGYYPRVVTASARTPLAIDEMLTQIETHQHDPDFLSLLDQIHKGTIHGHLYRGFVVLGERPWKEISEVEAVPVRPIWFVYSGIGSQWPGMGQALMQLEPFKRSILRSANALQPTGVDLLGLLDNTSTVLDSVLALVAVQIALTDILLSLDVVPDGILGYSLGEITSGYADGGFTAEQAIMVAYARGRAFLDSQVPPGALASIGLTWQAAKLRCPKDIYPVCHNTRDNVTVSGPVDPITAFVTELNAEGIPAEVLQGVDLPYHSRYIIGAESRYHRSLEQIITEPKRRGNRWVSTSVPEADWGLAYAQENSVDYHVNNLLAPVLFHEATQHVPENAIVIEIAPTAVLAPVLGKALGATATCVNLMQGGEDSVEYLLGALGRVFNAGGQPNLSKLFPPEFPVCKGTPMISPLIRWDHSIEWIVPNFYTKKPHCSEVIIEIDLMKEADQYLAGHMIDDRIIYPGSGYLVLIWKAFAKFRNQNHEDLPVVIENVRFRKAVVLSKHNPVNLLIHYFENDGEFHISENGTKIVTGRITTNGATTTTASRPSTKIPVPFTAEEVYKVLKLRGYDYDGEFCTVTEAGTDRQCGQIKWGANWVAFIDAMIHFYIFGQATKGLVLPTEILKLVIDPTGHSSTDGKIQVDTYRDLNIIKAGGVEIRELKLTLANRRHKTPAPKLEKYSFVPYDDQREKPKTEALTALLQIVIENNGSYNLKITQALDEPELRKILEAEPMVVFDITSGVKAPDQDLIFIGNVAQIGEWSPLVKDSGFLLVELPYNFNPRTSLGRDLALISIQTTACNNYILLRRKPKERPDTFIKIDNHLDWLAPLKQAMDQQRKICLYGGPVSGLVGLINCLKQEPGGSGLRGVLLEASDVDFSKQLENDLVQNVFKDNTWGSYRYLPAPGSGLKNVQHAYVNYLARGNLSSLRWIQAPQYPNACEVFYAALNFRDVMIASGKLPANALPAQLADQDCVLGLEFSGVDATGRRVMGMVPGKSLATSVVPDRTLLWELPEEWTLEDAATVPVVYTTAYYALVIRGRVQPGESILIHSGAGGVGQAAIAIALDLGCRVFTTVSSQEKKQFLRQSYPGVENNCIGNSRDVSFEPMVRSNTKGRGVDLVLNSLESEFLQASVRCLAPGGRFLEIGKVDLARNSQLGMSIFLKNTTFHGIHLDALFEPNFSAKTELASLIQSGIKSGVVRPLPRTVFDKTEIEAAFRFLGSAQHIGKVVLRVRDSETKLLGAVPRVYFDPDKSYIVTGGLGSFGLELTNWMVDRGAKHLVLTSRSGVNTAYQGFCIERWQSSGVEVLVSSTTADTEEVVRGVLQEARQLAPIAGIFNLAATLRDGLITNQTPDDFRAVTGPKIDLTRHLDSASRLLAPDLRYFVCFSSVASGRGHLGQSNYGLANSAMEQICEHRKQEGFPALAIQWGAIADVGIYSNAKKSNFQVSGTVPQRIFSCLFTLDALLQSDEAVLACSVIATSQLAASRVGPVEAVAKILGIKDVSQEMETAPLSTFGNDSIKEVEIRQVLERDYNVSLSIQEIRTLTFERIKEL